MMLTPGSAGAIAGGAAGALVGGGTGLDHDRLLALDGGAGHVVRMERLRLEGEEEGQPAVLVGEVEEEAAVLPDAVVLLMPLLVPLIHVDVMNPVSRLEAEVLVRFVL